MVLTEEKHFFLRKCYESKNVLLSILIYLAKDALKTFVNRRF